MRHFWHGVGSFRKQWTIKISLAETSFINVRPITKPTLIMTQQPPEGQGRLTVGASRSHSDTPHTVGLFWTSDQPYSETST
jgi:hypothetical protein